MRDSHQLQPAFHKLRKVIMILHKIFPFATAAAVAVSGAFAMSAPQAFAEFTSTSINTDNTTASGIVQVDLVDTNGALLSAPIVNISNAAPSMSAKTHTIRIKNNGTLPAAVLLHTANIVSDPTADLNDVLVATITDSSSVQLYSGSLADLSLNIDSLAAQSTLTLTLTITWPDVVAVDDNPYQDSLITFAVIADASNLIG